MAKVALLALGGCISNEDLDMAKPYEYVCAADSGSDRLKSFNIIPDLVIGDLDSVTPEGLKWAISKGAQVKEFPKDKDSTDAELACFELSSLGFDLIKIVGIQGLSMDRPDHMLFNYTLFGLEESLNLRIIGYSGGFEILAHQGVKNYFSKPGMIVSVMPFFGQASIKLEGLKWSFEGLITINKSRTISNIALGDFKIWSNQKILVFIQHTKSLVS